MSTQTIKVQNNSQLFVENDYTKFLLGGNQFVEADITAAGGNGVLLEGMVMGQISATEKIVPLDKDATDGSQYPFGLCIQSQTVANAATATIVLVNKGKIAESVINFFDVETLATPIGASNNQKTIRAWLNDLGLILEGGTDLTLVDNS